VLCYQIIPVTHYQQNCSLIWCDQTGLAAVIDPGGDVDLIFSAIEQRQLTLDKVLLTHGHLDHVGATAAVKARAQVPVIGPHEDDTFWLSMLPQQALMMGFQQADSFSVDQFLVHGDSVQLGQETLDVLHCPGHTPGHVVFVSAKQRLAWVGDVLFRGSIGRTDFPKGDHATLINAIRTHLFPLGDDITFIPGHGPVSTFGDERRTNPFVADTRFG
jgi:hydroxyacylglutathione hydrolase